MRYISILILYAFVVVGPFGPETSVSWVAVEKLKN
jgi:hypothetical protein